MSKVKMDIMTETVKDMSDKDIKKLAHELADSFDREALYDLAVANLIYQFQSTKHANEMNKKWGYGPYKKEN